jgi:ribosomal protein L9
VRGENKSINYSHAIKTTGNELAKMKAHPKTCTKTPLHVVPSYTLGHFWT